MRLEKKMLCSDVGTIGMHLESKSSEMIKLPISRALVSCTVQQDQS